MSKTPIVSVLMPVYNAERYVAEAVESILHQTFTDFELLIIDDGSTDRSRPILETLAARDDRIRFISRPNRGLIKTLNEMLTLAKGEFLARMDADDIALPDRFALQVKFLQQHPDVVCVGGAYDLVDPRGRIVMESPMPIHNDEIQQKLLMGHTIINHPCAMIRRTSLLKIGGYDEAMVTVEDLDVFLRLGEVGLLANLPETILKYRFHLHSVSSQNIAFQQTKAKEACERAWQRRNVTGHYAPYIPWFRPGADPIARQHFLHRYGWWAFCQGFRTTAAVCGIKAIALQPVNLESWKLFACALVKPMSKPRSS